MRRALLILITLLGLAGLVKLRRTGPSPPRASTVAGPTPAANRPRAPGVALTEVASVVLRDERDRKQWEFRAERIEVSDDRNHTLIRGLKQGVYFRDGKPLTTFRADEVDYDAVTKRLVIRGNVTAEDKRGFSLSAPMLTWSPEERKFVASGDITGAVKDLKFATTALSLWPDSERLDCPQTVRATSNSTELSSRRLTANLKTQRVQMTDVEGTVAVRRRPAEPVVPVDPALLEKRT